MSMHIIMAADFDDKSELVGENNDNDDNVDDDINLGVPQLG